MIAYQMIFFSIIAMGLYLKCIPVKGRSQKSILFLFIIIYLTVIIGFRSLSVGADTQRYFERVSAIAATPIFRINWLEHEPGFLLLIKILSFFNDNPRFILFMCALLTQISLATFYYKSSRNSYFIFGWLVYLGFLFPISVTAVRQWLALSIGVHAIECLNKEKEQYLKFYILIFIATMFHYTSIVYLFLLFFKNFWRSSKRSWFFFFLVCCIGVVFEIFIPIITRFIPMYSQYFYHYVNSSDSKSTYVKVAMYVIFIIFGMLQTRSYFPDSQESTTLRFYTVILSFLLLISIIGNKYYQVNRSGYYFSAYLPIITTHIFTNMKYDKLIKTIYSILVFILMMYTIRYGTNDIYPYSSVLFN